MKKHSSAKEISSFTTLLKFDRLDRISRHKLGKTQKRSKYHVFSYCLVNIELKNISKLEFPDRNFHGNVMLHKRN